MDEYIKYLNEEFNKKCFDAIFLDEICLSSENFSSKMATICNKYHDVFADYKKLKVSDEDCEVIIENCKSDNNILILAYMFFLIACNKKYFKNNKIFNVGLEYVNKYFSNFKSIKKSTHYIT